MITVGIRSPAHLSAQVIDISELNDLINTKAVTWWDVVWAGVVLLAGLGTAWVVRRIVRHALDRVPSVPEYARQLVVKMAGWLVILAAVVYALSLLGVDLGPIMMIMLFAFVLIFFAGRRLMDNFSAGLVLQAGTLFDVGDQVSIGTDSGTVAEIHGRAVIIETPDGKQVHVPNGKVLDDVVINLTRLGRRRSTIEVGVEYGTDLASAGAAMLEAVGSCARALADPPPEAFVEEYDDSSIDFDVRFWHDPGIWEQDAAIDEVARAIDRVFRERGIVIAFPQRVLWSGTDAPPRRHHADEPSEDAER
jgi:small-conductance mechanosensitive channel